MPPVNPYAPPKVEEVGSTAPLRARKKRGKGDIEAALAALDDHLANPDEVALDQRAAGGRLRPVTIVFLVLGAFTIAGGAAIPDDSRSAFTVAVTAFGVVLLLIGLIAAAMDFSMVPRDRSTTPILALKSYLRSFALGRYGYAWACLCPTARAQSVTAPSLGPVAAGLGEFSMQTQDGVKRYAATFSRPSGGYMRSLQIKRLTIEEQDGDVAVIAADLVFQSWPQWANIVMGVGVATGMRIGDTHASPASAPFRIFGIVAAIAGLIGLLVLRKRYTVTVHRTLLRGRNGAWYVFDPDLLEGAR